MVGGINLHRRADLAVIADAYRGNVEDHAVEVHEHVGAHTDVVAVVAVERRANHRTVTDLAEMLDQQTVTLLVEQFRAVVVALHPVLVGDLLGLQLRAAGVVELAAEHLLLFTERHLPSFGTILCPNLPR
ncbi:hypothetical protein D3C85_1484120 [compost metagenome]